MGSIIVDTSVWVDCFRGVQDGRTKLVNELLNHTNSIAITPTILQETLQGVRDDGRFVRIRENMLACVLLRLDPIEAAIEAAQLYRTLRRKGVTIRKPNDCLIAHYALYYNIPILHNDVDFEQIMRYNPLNVATP